MTQHKMFTYHMGDWRSSDTEFLSKLDDIVDDGGTIISINRVMPTNTNSFDGYKVIWKAAYKPTHEIQQF